MPPTNTSNKEQLEYLNQMSNNTHFDTQNNYIQINNTILNQETIKQLNAEQLNRIEEILKSVNPNTMY